MIFTTRKFFCRPALGLAWVAFLAACLSRVGVSHATPIVSRDINTYVLFAYNELVWKGGNVATDSGYIIGGNIGVNYPGAGITLSFGTSGRGIMSLGSQAVADSVRADDAQDVFYTLFANATNPSFGATVLDPNPDTLNFPKGNYPFTAPIINTIDLPTLPFTPNRALTNNASDLKVGGSGGLPSPQTIAPGAYKDVRFNDGVTVTFGPGVYDLRNLSIGKSVTINVSDATVLQIDQRFDPNDGLLFGANVGYHGGAKVLVGGFGDNPTSQQTTNFAHGSEFHGQYFAPNSWLDLGGGNELFGRFWANRITGDPNNNVVMVVPEPATAALMGVALGALVIFARHWWLRRKR